MWIIKYRNIFFTIAALLVGGSLLASVVYGLRPSIEFTGGTLLEVGYRDVRADKALVEEKLNALELGAYSLRPFGEKAYLLRVREIEQSEISGILNAFEVGGVTKPELHRQNTVGPTIGAELQSKAFAALLVVLALTIVYVAFAFRHVSEPVSSWKYGFIAILTLIHDITIPIGVFAVVGHFYGTAEVDVLFVTALLTILGYSVNDTIVIFDRVRENLRHNQEDEIEEPFEEVVGTSLEQTFVRSFNTSVTVLIVVVAILLFGGSATQYFALALTAGVIAGTYSSLFLAAPLLVAFEKLQAKKLAQKEVDLKAKK
ncbi:MAG: Protein translocase subunit SecF [Parcubacteria group bacterium GW2011_GWA2_43_11]|nr:MAG: Protein translocase subunit SecF [Parcubacteria group bacterium GW2011_GWA2_43_11]